MSRVLSEFSQERNAMPAQDQAICHMKQRYTRSLTNTNKNNKTNDNHQQQNGLLIVMALVMRITMTVDAGHDPTIVITIKSMTLHRIYQSKRTHTLAFIARLCKTTGSNSSTKYNPQSS